jgi:hypothetical protein
MAHPIRISWGIALLLALLPAAGRVLAVEILGVQNAALDQPRVNAQLRRTPAGPPLIGTDPIFGDVSNIVAFLDTGASGVILSQETTKLLGVRRTPDILFEDVGIGGTVPFRVSEPLFVDVGPFFLFADPAYNQQSGPLRSQIGPPVDPSNPLLGGIDVLGMPTMQGKVVVMDPKPLDDLSDLMHTYIYNPGTDFNPAAAESDPGIPPTNRTIDLSFGSFERFTRLTPPGAEGPTLSENPFIGPNPNLPPDDTPGITLKLGDQQTTGSFLLDTGAVASVISRDLADDLNVRYRDDSLTLELFDPADPSAQGIELENQFRLTLGGLGGNLPAAGFFLDSMLVRTKEGDALNDDDPAHLRYLGAPVLVADISLKDPVTLDELTLDGLFAMNFLVASIFFSEEPFAIGDFINPSPFNWVVFDADKGELRLDVRGLAEGTVSEPGSLYLALLALVVAGFRLRRSHGRAESSRAFCRRTPSWPQMGPALSRSEEDRLLHRLF